MQSPPYSSFGFDIPSYEYTRTDGPDNYDENIPIF